MSSYNPRTKVLRLTSDERNRLLTRNGPKLKPNAPMLLAMQFRLADIVICSGLMIKARRPWDTYGPEVPRGHGDVKKAIEAWTMAVDEGVFV